jgi:hypothetical protein
MITASDVEAITASAWELAEQITELCGEDVVLEEFMIIAAVAMPNDSDVEEQIAFSCSSAHSYVQEGLLVGALRENDLRNDE